MWNYFLVKGTFNNYSSSSNNAFSFFLYAEKAYKKISNVIVFAFEYRKIWHSLIHLSLHCYIWNHEFSMFISQRNIVCLPYADNLRYVLCCILDFWYPHIQCWLIFSYPIKEKYGSAASQRIRFFNKAATQLYVDR